MSSATVARLLPGYLRACRVDVDASFVAAPTRRTIAAYGACRDAVLRDGQTVAAAYGAGGWLPCDDADPYPNLHALTCAADTARDPRFQAPVYVSDVNHNGAMLGSDATNLAFRAHHDALHVLSGLGFGLDDESEVAARTVCTLHLCGDAAAVVAGEIIGQSVYFASRGFFPTFNGRQPTFHVNAASLAWARDAFNTLATTEIFACNI